MTEPRKQNTVHDQFSEYLHRHNMRCTAERFAILDAVMATVDHFSIDTFYESIEKAGFHVSRATVYNTLQLLTECGLVRRHLFDNRSAKFERIQNNNNHHHLICTVCGNIKEVRDPDIVRQIGAKRYSSFNAGYFTLYVYGVCSRCARRKRRQNKNDK